jgi:hypothetical protein
MNPVAVAKTSEYPARMIGKGQPMGKAAGDSWSGFPVPRNDARVASNLVTGHPEPRGVCAATVAPSPGTRSPSSRTESLVAGFSEPWLGFDRKKDRFCRDSGKKFHATGNPRPVALAEHWVSGERESGSKFLGTRHLEPVAGYGRAAQTSREKNLSTAHDTLPVFLHIVLTGCPG